MADDRMVTRRLRVVLAVMCILGLSGTISSHEVPVHWEITAKAVDYLAVSRPELQTCAADLKIRLGKGVGAEDDPYEPQLLYAPHGNFMFHFDPQLEDLFLTTAGVATAHATRFANLGTRGVGPCVLRHFANHFANHSAKHSNDGIWSADERALVFAGRERWPPRSPSDEVTDQDVDKP